MPENLALAVLRRLAEHGAQVGFSASPSGPLRFAVRGPEGAQPLLLLHGLGDSIAGWARLAAPLARRFRLHLLDLPGHGLSASPRDFRLATLLEAIVPYAEKLEQPLLAGHSLGGWLAVRLAQRLAQPRGLILINPGGARLAQEAWEPFRALLSATDAAGARRYLERAFYSAPLLLRLAPGEVLKAMASPAARGFLQSIEPADFLGAAELQSLRLPARLVWGRADRLLPEGSLEFFREHLPGAQLVLLDRAGHLPHLEQPAALARALLQPLG